jgi:hypothetical protein
VDEVTEAVGISGEAPVFRGACLRVLTVVCEDMTPQSDLWRLWKRKLTRVATHSESPRLHSLQRRHQRRQSGGRGGVGQFRRQTCPETLHSRGRGTPRIALCTPITSGDGEGTWEVRRRHAPAPPESAVLAGVKKAGRRIKRAICKPGKLGESCYPTNLRVTNPSLFRQSVGRNASMPVVPAPAPTHQRHGVAGVRVVLPPWPRCALRVISSRRGFHSMCIPALRRARIEQRALEPDFDPPEPQNRQVPVRPVCF